MLDMALICLAMTVFYESKSEPLAGQYAVASVVMNRAHNEKNRICEVITAPNQFSWVRKNTFTKTKNGYTISKEKIPKGALWDKSLAVSKGVLYDGVGLLPKVKYFHATHVNPKWHYVRLYRIGNHWFYS